MSQVFSDDDIIGRFHCDLLDEVTDDKWRRALKSEKNEPGILIIQSGQFGLDGKVLQQLAETASVEEIKRALSESNAQFANAEKRKVYERHVVAGRRAGIYFENEIPYGEDIDGDGEIEKGRQGNGNNRRNRRGR